MTTRQTVGHQEFSTSEEFDAKGFMDCLTVMIDAAKKEFGELTISIEAVSPDEDGHAEDVMVYVSGHVKHPLRYRRNPNSSRLPCVVCDFAADSDVHHVRTPRRRVAQPYRKDS